MASLADILKAAVRKVASAAAETAKSAVATAGLGGVAYSPGTADHFVYVGEWVNRPGSSNVAGYGYSFKRRVMNIKFNNGTEYQYYNVPPEKARALFDSDSAGKAVWRLFRVPGSKWAHQHAYRRVA